MTISSSTQAILAAQKYSKNLLTLNEKKFIDSLAEDVCCIHSRVKGGFDTNTEQLIGKADVSAAYHKHFFAITNNFHVQKEIIKGFGLKASIKHYVDEDKQDEDNIVRRYCMVCRTQLDFIKKEDGTLKIIKIWERTSKDPI